jgi:hypothetical protein
LQSFLPETSVVVTTGS